MKKLLCSILVGLAALSVTGCDDDEVKTPDFAVSTAQWTFSQQEGMQRMIVSAPGAWTLTGIPDWMTVTPAGGGRSLRDHDDLHDQRNGRTPQSHADRHLREGNTHHRRGAGNCRSGICGRQRPQVTARHDP